MTVPCPYCATACTGEVMATCPGCGNPVSISGQRRALRVQLTKRSRVVQFVKYTKQKKAA